MTSDDNGTPASQPSGPVALDPFGFLVGVASRVPGLGGSTPGYDPNYVFHTPYVAAARGPATFEIQFDNLRARTGTLTLRVHMLPDEPGGIARMVNSERIQLNRLAKERGVVRIGFDGFRGVTHSVMGLITDSSDVQADNIRVTLDRPADTSAEESFVEARSTTFGNDQVLATAQMISSDPPTIALPVSQPCTVAQFGEGAFRDWLSRLALPPSRTLDQWALVYRLQVLRSYGMLEAGARALGFADQDEAFTGALGAAGVAVTIAAPAAERTVVEMEPLNPPPGFVNYDLLWSTDPGRVLSSPGQVSLFAEHSLACLRPGGLGIHVFRTVPGTEAVVDEQGVRLPRGALERIALMLISRGDEVAQLKSSLIGDSHPEGLFGIIVRKARTVL